MTTPQLSLFGPAAPAKEPTPTPPTRQPGKRARGRGESPQVAAEVLTEVADGHYGFLDDTDHVMVFVDGGERVRKALDDPVIHHLIRAGLVERAPMRETVSCRHGAIIKPVTPLRLTKRGRAQQARWAALHPVGATS